MTTDTSASNTHLALGDEGVGSIANDNGTFDSAGSTALLGHGTGVGWKTESDFTLSSLDTTNETVDVETGVAWLPVSSVDVQAGLFPYGSSVDPHDESLPIAVYFPVVCYATETIDLDADTDQNVYLVLDTNGTGGDNTSAGDIYYRHAASAPSHPSLKIGEADSTEGGNGTDSSFNEGPKLDIVSIDGSLTGDTEITDLIGNGMEVSSGSYGVVNKVLTSDTSPTSGEGEDGDVHVEF